LLFGCEPEVEQQLPDAEYCAVESTSQVPVSDRSLGFSGEDVLDFSEGVHDNFMDTGFGTPVGLIIDVIYNGDDLSLVETDLSCNDYLQIPVTIALSMANGLFNETWDVTLRASDDESASFGLRLELDEINGSYTQTDLDAADWNEIYIQVSGGFSTQGCSEGRCPSGVIELIAKGDDITSGDAVSNNQQRITLGSWPGM
jgi:hypothetical protein